MSKSEENRKEAQRTDVDTVNSPKQDGRGLGHQTESEAKPYEHVEQKQNEHVSKPGEAQQESIDKGVTQASETLPQAVDSRRVDGDTGHATSEGAGTMKVTCILNNSAVYDFSITPNNNDDTDNRTVFVPAELWDEYTLKKSEFKDTERKLIDLWGQNGQ